MRQLLTTQRAWAILLLSTRDRCQIAREPKWPYGATYGKGRLVFNLSRCGRAFFEQSTMDNVNRLLIHEFAHHYESDHLSERYYDALADLAARNAGSRLNSQSCFVLTSDEFGSGGIYEWHRNAP